VGGYTDNTGDPGANQKLSQDRATAVFTELVTLGVPAQRMSAEGYGQQYPVADNSTDSGRAQNRRIALRVTDQELVASLDERESERRRRRAGARAVAPGQQLRHAAGGPLAEPHLHQRADDVAHHVLQEGRRLDAVDEQRRLVAEAALEDATHRPARRLP